MFNLRARFGRRQPYYLCKREKASNLRRALFDPRAGVPLSRTESGRKRLIEPECQAVSVFTHSRFRPVEYLSDPQ